MHALGMEHIYRFVPLKDGQKMTLPRSRRAAVIPPNRDRNKFFAAFKSTPYAPSSKQLIFTLSITLSETYKMVDTCDPNIAGWTEEGDMFVVKDPDIFATQVIPQYFDHNKFSSFARQLNFYGFRKMQSKPIRNSDYDANAAKHVTFFNENFKRGRCDLLKKIQRSTRGTGTGAGQDHSRDIQMLREQVSSLEQRLEEVQTQSEERLRRLELDMLARMEQVMMAMQQQQQTQLQLHAATSVGTTTSGSRGQMQQQQHQPASVQNALNQRQQSWDPTGLNFPRGNSVQSVVSNSNNNVGSNGMSNSNSNNSNPTSFPMPGMPGNTMAAATSNPSSSGPTLPPHPKMKQQLPPMNGLPGSNGAPPGPPVERFNSLRGLSVLSRGLSGLARGTSVESSASAVLLRNSWEDKFFSMLMLDENGNATNAAQAAAAASGNSSMTPGTTTSANGQQGGPVRVSDRSLDMDSSGMMLQNQEEGADELSSVSSSDMP